MTYLITLDFFPRNSNLNEVSLVQLNLKIISSSLFEWLENNESKIEEMGALLDLQKKF